MPIKKLQKAKRVVLIALLSIISIANLLEYKVYEQNAKKESQLVTELTIFIKEHTVGCWFKDRNYIVQVTQCAQYPLGTVLLYSGNPTVLSANARDSVVFVQSTNLSLDSVVIPEQQQLPNKVQAKFLTLRHQMRSVLQIVLPEAQAQLLFSLVFGGSAFLPDFVKHQVQIAGAQDLLAASGMHVTILTLLLLNLTRLRSSYLQFFCIILSLVSYSLLALSSVSVVRAAIMCVVAFYARAVGRQNHSLSFILILALSLIAQNVEYLFSISFQLSFGAVLAINLWGSLDRSRKSSLITDLESAELSHLRQPRESFRSTLRSYVVDTCKISVVVQVFLLPLLLYHFGEISLVSIISSLAVLWMMPILFTLGLATTLLVWLLHYHVSASTLLLLAVPVSPFITLLQQVLKLLEPLEWLRVAYTPSVAQIVLFYLVLAMIYVTVRNKINDRRYRSIEYCI